MMAAILATEIICIFQSGYLDYSGAFQTILDSYYVMNG